MTRADDVSASVTEELLNSLCQITDGRSISLLNEQIAGVCMLEGKHDQIHSLIQIHQETSHVRVGDGDRVAGFDLINKQRDNAAAAAHDVAVTGAANGRTATFRRNTSICINDMFHHSLGNAHRIDRVSCFVGGQADHTLDASVNGSVQHIISTDDVSLNGLHREELTGRNLLQSSGMENVINTGHCITDGLRVTDIADVELHLFGILRMLSLKLMAHIILLFLVTRENADFLQARIQEMLQNSRSKRTSTTSDHKGCVIKCRHFLFPPNLIAKTAVLSMLFHSKVRIVILFPLKNRKLESI